MAAPTYSTLKANVKLGQGQKLGFTTGKGYYARGAAPAQKPADDSFSPLSSAAITNQIAGYTAGLPRPLNDQQIRGRAQQTIDPLIAALTSRAQAQGKAAAGAIGGYANSEANALGAGAADQAGIYGNAEKSQAATDAALSSALRGGGSDLANSLASQLNAFGAGDQAKQDFVNPQAGIGDGAANALLGTGSASLAQLIANGASAGSYAAKQPGLARMQGASDIRDATMANNKSLADNVSGVTSQLPSIVGQLRNENDTKAANLAGTKIDLAKFYQARNDAISAGMDKNAATVQAAQIAGASKAQTAQLAQQNKDRSYSLEYARVYGVDPATGQPTLAAVKAAKAADQKAAKKRAGLTPTGYANLKKQAAAQADTFYYGVNPKQHYDAKTQKYTDVPGTGVPGVDYSTAVRRLVSKYSVSVADAQKMLNDYYAPGERGRPSKPLPKPTPDRGFRDAKLK